MRLCYNNLRLTKQFSYKFYNLKKTSLFYPYHLEINRSKILTIFYKQHKDSHRITKIAQSITQHVCGKRKICHFFPMSRDNGHGRNSLALVVDVQAEYTG